MANPYQSEAARILAVRRETAVDRTFRIACALRPAPGQFVEVSLPGVGEAPISVSGLGDGWLELTLRKVGCLTGALFQLGVGDQLQVRGPYGHGWPLAAFAGKHLVVAAGGTGLAPVRMLIDRFAAEPAALAGFELLAGFKTPADLLFQEDLARWGRRLRVQATVDKGAPGWTGRVGLITALVPELALPAPAEAAVVVVGPPLMMKFTAVEFLRRGIPEENLWLSFERRMQCGLGKCGHCKIDATYVCLDGPVLNYTQAKRLLD
ncbi:MAG: anaerobic sulfite reductase subunit AsrB [Lentisphaeria bacterium]|jgi:anaerobic sulfite reductase subunit B